MFIIFNNKIGDEGIKYLGLGLSKLIKLKYLNLNLDYNLNNKIGGEGIKYLGLGLSKLIKLNYLKLDFRFKEIFLLFIR